MAYHVMCHISRLGDQDELGLSETLGPRWKNFHLYRWSKYAHSLHLMLAYEDDLRSDAL
jgi:hypothetical protein